MILNTKPEDRHGFGRSKLRWLYDLEPDIKTLAIKRLRLKAQDIKEWTVILREAKANYKGRKAREEEEEEEEKKSYYSYSKGTKSEFRPDKWLFRMRFIMYFFSPVRFSNTSLKQATTPSLHTMEIFMERQ
jgi:hypothetical protein